MDALEIDLEDDSIGLPDLKPGNVARELRKAYTAFCSNQRTSGAPYKDVYTGFWGCGTFGGNVSVKTMVQWCAASKAGVGCLRFICSGEEQERFGRRMEGFVEWLRGLEVRTKELEDVLLGLAVMDVEEGEDALDVVRGRLWRMDRPANSERIGSDTNMDSTINYSAVLRFSIQNLSVGTDS